MPVCNRMTILSGLVAPALLMAWCLIEPVYGDEGACLCSPATLFQWSYGTSFGGGAALDEPLITDRPDFTESSTAVGQGVTQLEFGYTYSFDDEAGTSVRSHSYPELLVRQGVGWDWLEFRASWNYAEQETRLAGVTTADDQGSEDLVLGFKIALTPQEGVLPEMGLLTQFSVPSGSAPFRDEEVLPGVTWLYSWEVTECLGLAGNSLAFMALDETTGDDFVSFAQSLALGYALGDTLGSYLEWYGIFPSGADSQLPEQVISGGLTYLVSNDFQLDVRAGLGLNDNTDDYFVGTGAAVRY